MFCAPQRLVEAFTVERLEQVIERVDFKGAQRVLIVSRDEYDHGRLINRLQYAEAVEFRHLHVEEDQFGLVSFDGRHRRQSVAAFADDLYLGISDEHIYNPLARQRLVVNTQRSDFIHKLYPSPPPATE